MRLTYKQKQKAADKKHIQENVRVFSYNDIKEAAYVDDVINGILCIHISKLKEIINSRL